MNGQPLPQELLILDKTATPYHGEILYPFALEEVLCRRVGQGHPPIVHLWIHPKAFVVGLRDRRLPNAVQAMEDLRGQGYVVAVRNSGGAAVPLDPGVVNISLILPKSDGAIDIHVDFALMAGLIGETVERMAGLNAKPEAVKVHAGEVVGSYCPGDFDLSIHGRKFCGIAQRRQTRAHVIQAFINVTHDEDKRAEAARGFYRKAAADEPGVFVTAAASSRAVHPLIASHTMASLDDFIGEMSVAHFVDEFINTLQSYAKLLGPLNIPEPLQLETLEMIRQLKERYDPKS